MASSQARRRGRAPYVDMGDFQPGTPRQRTVGLNLSVAVFLNIGTDHISPVEHPTFRKSQWGATEDF